MNNMMIGAVSLRKKFVTVWALNQGPLDPDASSLSTE